MVFPPQGVLDFPTRIDELLIRLIKQNEELTRMVGTLDRTIQIITPAPQQADKAEMRRRAENGSWFPYQTFTISSMPTAVTDELHIIEGDFIHAWTDGSLVDIGVRLNHPDADILYFNRRNPIQGFNFWKVYLSYPVQSGKKLDIMFGREASATAQTTEVTVSTSQKIYTIRSDKDTHFTLAIAQNAKEDESLTGLIGNKIRITGVALQSDQNLDYRVIFWKTDGFDNTDLNTDKFCGEVQFDIPTFGYQIAGSNQFYLDVRGLAIDYEDEDDTHEIHVSLMNLSATSKNSGGAGEVTLDIYYEPRV